MKKNRHRQLTLHEKWALDGEAIRKSNPEKYNGETTNEEVKEFAKFLDMLKSKREKRNMYNSKEMTRDERQALADELEQLKRDREKKGYK